MPVGTKVHSCVQKVKARGGGVNPYAVCQASTGQSYATGKPLKKKKHMCASCLQYGEEQLAEDSPKGWHGTVRAMLTHKDAKKDIDNPWALAHWMKKKGDKPHYEDQPTSKKGKPEKKEKYKNEHFTMSFREWFTTD